MIVILGIVKSTFPGKSSQDLADEEERESERADVPDVEVDSPGKVVAILKMKTFAIIMMIPDGNFAIFMMIMTIIMIPDVEVDPQVK